MIYLDCTTKTSNFAITKTLDVVVVVVLYELTITGEIMRAVGGPVTVATAPMIAFILCI